MFELSVTLIRLNFRDDATHWLKRARSARCDLVDNARNRNAVRKYLGKHSLNMGSMKLLMAEAHLRQTVAVGFDAATIPLRNGHNQVKELSLVNTSFPLL